MTAPKTRALLGVLLAAAGRAVTRSTLCEELWGARQPPSADKTLQLYISRLRRVLGDPRGTRLVTVPYGYRLAVGPGELDAHRFDDLAARGHRALEAGEHAAAVRALEAALRLWRGPMWAGLEHVPALAAESMRWEERRLEVQDRYFDAVLGTGGHRDVLPRIRAAVRDDPLRESTWARLLLALHQDGRSTEALRTYAAARRRFAEELGAEPGPELRRIHQRLLAESAGAEPVCQLPPPLADFVGRRVELTELRRGVGGAGPLLVTGPPGVGKTALAVQVAHAARADLPGAQLHADLRGCRGRPADPAEVLGGFLRALGVAEPPSSLGERAAEFRARLADRRALVVLDDAVDEAQVRPLLPGAGPCVALITSRYRLGGLEGVRRWELDVLPADDAGELINRVAGGARPRDVTALVRCCGRLPLALRIVGARLATGTRSAARLAEDLAPEEHRLDGLVIGDLNVRTRLASSYRRLGPQARRAFRCVGSLGAEPVPAGRVTAALGVDATRARRYLDELVAVHLVEPVGPPSAVRFRMHELIRLYAREVALAEASVARGGQLAPAR
ncbi:BTAD domain-containing putative transcriptional regulator [Saccharopolyspora sp. CA-218241]|uniref:AfsR/SARP family transcriptional regulator n=1 Tax=Saccharopolyspora sp. CA-218241 TaxID=3240027 RepID=UPI003D97CF8E